MSLLFPTSLPGQWTASEGVVTAMFRNKILHVHGFDSVRILRSSGESPKIQATPLGIWRKGS